MIETLEYLIDIVVRLGMLVILIGCVVGICAVSWSIISNNVKAIPKAPVKPIKPVPPTKPAVTEEEIWPKPDPATPLGDYNLVNYREIKSILPSFKNYGTIVQVRVLTVAKNVSSMIGNRYIYDMPYEDKVYLYNTLKSFTTVTHFKNWVTLMLHQRETMKEINVYPLLHITGMLGNKELKDLSEGIRARYLERVIVPKPDML